MIFRRRGRGEPAADVPDVGPPADAAEDPSAPGRGPWDAADIRLDEDDNDYIDFGGLMIRAREDLEIQLQSEEEGGPIVAILLVTPESALELRAFAATRSGGLWDEVRRELTGEATRIGATTDAVDGPYGPELRVAVPVQTPDGQAATQPTRVVGIEGPRWLLRATFLGVEAFEPSPDAPLAQSLQDVIVVRGGHAMPPGEALEIRLPDGTVSMPDADPGRPE